MLINLLPKDTKRALHTEYRYRRRVAAAFLFSAVLLISTIALLPAFFLSFTKKTSALEQQKIAEQAEAEREQSDISRIVHATNRRMRILSADTRSIPPLRSVLEAVLDERPAGVALSGFFYEARTKDGRAFIVKGIAQNREAATNLVANMREHEMFSSVELPISDLAPRTDIPFTITAIMRSVQKENTE